MSSYYVNNNLKQYQTSINNDSEVRNALILLGLRHFLGYSHSGSSCFICVLARAFSLKMGGAFRLFRMTVFVCLKKCTQIVLSQAAYSSGCTAELSYRNRLQVGIPLLIHPSKPDSMMFAVQYVPLLVNLWHVNQFCGFLSSWLSTNSSMKLS